MGRWCEAGGQGVCEAGGEGGGVKLVVKGWGCCEAGGQVCVCVKLVVKGGPPWVVVV